MPDTNLTFYDCRREDETPVGKQNVDLCGRWLHSQHIEFKSINANADGSLRLNLSGTRAVDLSALTLLPLTHLCLAGCWRITDFNPLRKMDLIWLNLTRTGITDLSPLRNLPLTYLSLCRTKVATLSPVARLPLRWLDIRSTQVTTLLSLRRMPLQELFFFTSRIRRGLNLLRSIGTLTRLNGKTPEEFWARHDGRQPMQDIRRDREILPRLAAPRRFQRSGLLSSWHSSV
jgi:hypothetical protein